MSFFLQCLGFAFVTGALLGAASSFVDAMESAMKFNFLEVPGESASFCCAFSLLMLLSPFCILLAILFSDFFNRLNDILLLLDRLCDILLSCSILIGDFFLADVGSGMAPESSGISVVSVLPLLELPFDF